MAKSTRTTKARTAAKEAPAGPVFDSVNTGNLMDLSEDVYLPEEIEARKAEEVETLSKDAFEVKQMTEEMAAAADSNSPLAKLSKAMMDKLERLEQKINQVGTQAFTQNRRATPTPTEDIMDKTPVDVVVISTGHFRFGTDTYHLDRAGAMVKLPRCFANRLKKCGTVRDLV